MRSTYMIALWEMGILVGIAGEVCKHIKMPYLPLKPIHTLVIHTVE